MMKSESHVYREKHTEHEARTKAHNQYLRMRPVKRPELKCFINK